MSAFDDIRLPEDVEVGAQGGPTFSTGIITMSNGQEQRNQGWAVARNSYTIGYGVSDSDWQAVRAFFFARRGRLRGFRFKDWTDFTGTLDPVYVFNGVLQLAHTYTDSIGSHYVRQITRVVPGTLKLFDANGVDFTSQYQESYGRITLNGTAGANPLYSIGQVGNLFATYEYDLPVRFDTDQFVLTAETILAASVGSLPLIELIENSTTLNGG